MFATYMHAELELLPSLDVPGRFRNWEQHAKQLTGFRHCHVVVV